MNTNWRAEVVEPVWLGGGDQEEDMGDGSGNGVLTYQLIKGVLREIVCALKDNL